MLRPYANPIPIPIPIPNPKSQISNPKSQIMASTFPPFPLPNRIIGICQIIGYACIIAFILNMLLLLLPPQFQDTAWRTNFLQQFSDRSIILLFGCGLVMAGIWDNPPRQRQLSLVCLFLGGIYLITCLLVVRDTIALRQLSIVNIDAQEAQVQTQLQEAQSKSTDGKPLTPEEIKRATKELSEQVATAKQNAQTTVIKTGINILINLTVVGLGLIGLGRFGLKAR